MLGNIFQNKKQSTVFNHVFPPKYVVFLTQLTHVIWIEKSLCLLVFSLCAVILWMSGWVTSGIIAAICSVKYDIFYHFLTHDVKDRVESVIMSKCLSSDTVCMTLWRLKSGVEFCLFCKGLANCFRAVGMTGLAVAQVTMRLWNPQAVNAAFTTGWKFRKSRCPTQGKLLERKLRLDFFTGKLGGNSSPWVLQLDVPIMAAFIATAAVIDSFDHFFHSLHNKLNCQCYMSAKKAKAVWCSPTVL